MKKIFYYLKLMFTSSWENRQLIKTLAVRDIESRYRGSIAGLGWAVINPIILLATYTFIFSVVFQAKWHARISSKSEFALIIFSGMIIFNAFAECINRAPSLITSNPNYVKKIIFPLDILPIVILLSSFFHALISIVVWIIFYFIIVGMPHWSIFLLPLVFLPLVFYIVGLSWILASLGVFFRDIIQIVTLFLTALMFLSPVFYPISAIPKKFRVLMDFNPLAGILEQTRNVLFDQAPLDWKWFIISSTASFFLAFLGFIWFQKTRKGFADVI